MKDRDRLDRRRLLGLGLVLPLGALPTPVRSLAVACGVTPRQTSGPFFPLWDQLDKDVDLTKLLGHDRGAAGTVLRVEGRVLDEDCRAVPRARVDLWQADSNGRYSHPADPNPARTLAEGDRRGARRHRGPAAELRVRHHDHTRLSA